MDMKYFLFTMTALFALPTMAQPDFGPTQYSGPGAQIESKGMGSPSPISQRQTHGLFESNDTNIDARMQQRQDRIYTEMDRKREQAHEINEKQRMKDYLLNLNE